MISYLIVFIFGSIIGSFLNVCIYRMPRDESIVFPGSRCTACKKSILWYDNIPLFSYVLLYGKCRNCSAKISVRYFTVELLTAVLLVVLYKYFGFTVRFWAYGAVTCGLIVSSFIDLDFQVIPDAISMGGLLLGIISSSVWPGIHGGFYWKEGAINSFLGVIAGAGLIYSVRALGNLGLYTVRRIAVCRRKDAYLRKTFAKYRHMKESMGMGDVCLMGMLGAFLGWKKAILVFFMAPFFCTPIGLYLKFKKNYDIIPYGPYIAIAAYVAMIWGDGIITILF